MNYIGYIIKTNDVYVVLALPYTYFVPKYSKLVIYYKKYFILDYRKELKKGDIVLYNAAHNKVLRILTK